MPLDQTNWSQTETETKPDVFSLESLIAWLETQPSETEYDFFDCDGGCLIGQYLIATTGKDWHGHKMLWSDMPKAFSAVAGVYATKSDGTGGGKNGATFGAALSRARALLASRPQE